jgi:hypothetical protein
MALARAAYAGMKRMLEAHGDEYLDDLCGAIQSGQMKFEEVSIRALTEALVPDGREFVEMLNPRHSLNFREAAAVNTEALGIVASNLVFTKIQEQYEKPEYVLSRLVPTEQGKPGEIMPKIIPLGDDASIVPEGEEYPSAVIGADYQIMPHSQKEGTIVPITREAVYEDRTNQIISFAAQVGDTLALRKEYRLCDTMIGYHQQAGGMGTLYNWRGTEYAPYQLSSPWINALATNELVDHTDLDGIETLFGEMVDENTGLPISVGGTQVFVMPAKKQTAARVFNSTKVTYSTVPATDHVTLAEGQNPVSGYTFEAPQHLYNRVKLGGNAGAAPSSTANARQYWYVGDVRKALCWWEQFPLKVESRGLDSEANFLRDIVMRFKASQKGTGAWKNPRFMIKAYNVA